MIINLNQISKLRFLKLLRYFDQLETASLFKWIKFAKFENSVKFEIIDKIYKKNGNYYRKKRGGFAPDIFGQITTDIFSISTKHLFKNWFRRNDSKLCSKGSCRYKLGSSELPKGEVTFSRTFYPQGLISKHPPNFQEKIWKIEIPWWNYFFH